MPNNQKNVELNITFKNTAGTEPLKAYASDKIEGCIRKFAHHDVDANLVLSVEKNRQIAELSFRANGGDFACREETGDMYASIDSLVSSVTEQLRRHKEKKTSHY